MTAENRTSMPAAIDKGARRALLLIAALHVLISLVVIPFLGPRLASSYGQEKSSDGYDLLAASLDAGHGYRFYPDTAPTLMREPGYPLLLAAVQLVFGSSFATIRCTNLVLTLLTAFLTTHLMRHLMPESSRARSLAPAALFLLHPGVLLAENRGGVELIFAFLLVLFALTIARALESRRDLDFVLSGVVLGITVLVRSTPMLFPFLFAPWFIFHAPGARGRLTAFRQLAWVVLAMAFVLTPWTIRNYRLVGRVVPTASVMGISAQAGQYINEHLFDGRPFWILDREASRIRSQEAMRLGIPFEGGADSYYQMFYKSRDEIRFSDELLHQTVTKYRQDPGLYLRVCAQNALNFWIAGKTWLATGLNAIIQIPLLVFALLGVKLLFRRGRRQVLIMLLVLMSGILAIHIAVLAQARYSIPLMPFVSVLACIGAVGLRRNPTSFPDQATVISSRSAS
jgi:hypothetical protein